MLYDRESDSEVVIKTCLSLREVKVQATTKYFPMQRPSETAAVIAM